MRKLKTATLKVLLFALCFAVTVIYCFLALLFYALAGIPYFAVFSAGVPLLTFCLLAAWWFAMRKSWSACIVSGLLAELSLLLQGVVYIICLFIAIGGTVSVSVAFETAMVAVMLLATAFEFALVWIIQKRMYLKFRDNAFAAAPAVRRGMITACAWMAVGVACAVFWTITLALGFGRYWWPLALGAIPLILCIAAFCYAWWLSVYRGKGAAIAFNVLMVILNFLLFIAAVYMGYAANTMLTVILAFSQGIWFILYIAMEAYRCIRIAMVKRKDRQNDILPKEDGNCA
ncbi:MAG: hypothetical protein LUD51_04045 [Clostridia bacterium]|nr:hypothetical protein [Clostridia bacterium]